MLLLRTLPSDAIPADVSVIVLVAPYDWCEELD
jgi:hypothetical protein